MTGNFFERASAIVSLVLLAGLALAAWLLTELALRPIWDSDYRSRSQMNSLVTHAEVLQTDASGQPKYLIQTPRLSLFDDGSAEMESPLLLALRKDAPAVRARADQASVSADQNLVALQGKAQIERDAYGNESEIRIATDWVRFDLEAQTAETTAAVRVTQGKVLLTGVGMIFDQRAEQISVLSQSQMILPGREKSP